VLALLLLSLGGSRRLVATELSLLPRSQPHQQVVGENSSSARAIGGLLL
jgi:hypothetical protein